jgi:tetratricopeptide (TPR) repeat protein
LVLNIKGNLAEQRGDLSEAMTWIDHAIAALREDRRPTYLAATLNYLGRIMMASANMDRAYACFQESLELAYETKAANLIAQDLYDLAALAAVRGQPQVAISHAEDAIRRFRRLGIKREQTEAETLLAKLIDESQSG